jgi:hypothetical protein
VSPVAKSDGLMKKTFSIVVDGNIWHVVWKRRFHNETLSNS